MQMTPGCVNTVPALPRHVLAARANFQEGQRDAGAIHCRNMLASRREEQCVPSGAAGNIQCWPVWQQRQQFADDTRSLRGPGLVREPVLGIPIGLAMRHKKRLLNLLLMSPKNGFESAIR